MTTNYTVKVERLTTYTVDAENEDAAIALVRRCSLESRIRQHLIDAMDAYTLVQAEGSVSITDVEESPSAWKTPRPIVWVRNSVGVDS